jgi:ABC-2 type transport system ATP-binding protein
LISTLVEFMGGLTMSNAIEVRDLVVVRGKRPVLNGLTCTVERGTVTGLLGPSGSGKTTLLRSVVGVQKITSGTVTVLGEPAGSATLRRSVGYLTQAPSVYSDLTVRENARYFASLYGVGATQADAAVNEVGLAAAAHQLVGNLSGGQQTRVSLACTLLGDPEVIILDEPTVGQDPVLRHDLWQRFNALAEAGVTLLVSSHVMDEAGRCARLLLIRDGDLIADDTPDAIRATTGTDDLEEAFLRLIRGRESRSDAGHPTSSAEHPTPRPAPTTRSDPTAKVG